MPHVTIPGASLWFETTGQGPTVVCLHSGWGRRLWGFEEAAALLGDRFRFVVVDRPGYGRSSPLDHLGPDYHREGARDLAAVIDALGLTRPMLWGHSDGAIIAALHAAAAPDTVAALVLEAPHYFRAKSPEFFERHRDPRELPEGVQRMLADEHGEQRWPTVISMHARAWLGFHEIGGDFYEGSLGQIAAPTLVVLGENDPHTPPEEAREITRRIPDATLELVAGGGHAPHAEPAVAAGVIERIGRFLDQAAEHPPRA